MIDHTDMRMQIIFKKALYLRCEWYDLEDVTTRVSNYFQNRES